MIKGSMGSKRKEVTPNPTWYEDVGKVSMEIIEPPEEASCLHFSEGTCNIICRLVNNPAKENLNHLPSNSTLRPCMEAPGGSGQCLNSRGPGPRTYVGDQKFWAREQRIEHKK